LVVGDVLDRDSMLLIGCVVDEDVQAAQFGHGAGDGLFAERRIADVAGNQQSAAAFVADSLFSLSGVGLFDWQIDNGDVGAFAGKQDGHGATDARVAAGDERSRSRELARAAILGSLKPGSRPDLRFDTGLRLVLRRERGSGL
jgi:hypothetical protein